MEFVDSLKEIFKQKFSKFSLVKSLKLKLCHKKFMMT